MKIKYLHFPSLPSTSSYALNELSCFERDELTVISVDEQPGGRGRFGRSWIAPPHCNITASFVLFVDPEVELVSLGLLLAITGAELIKKEGLMPRFKWPNDLLVSGRKIGGILAESRAIDDQMGVVLGIGLNVNTPLEELKLIDQPATSLLAEKGHKYHITPLIETLATLFVEKFSRFSIEGFSPFLKDLEALRG